MSTNQPTADAIREFVIAGHGNLARVKEMLAEQRLLENAAPDLTWKNFQEKTALETATDSGNTEIVELLKSHGATV